MRLLTIVSLAMATSSNIAVTTCEVPFSVLCEELNLTSDEVERVVMEGEGEGGREEEEEEEEEGREEGEGVVCTILTNHC